MHRLLVALLAALDAVLAAASGIAVVLAPLTLLWVVGLGSPDWSALWPATAGIWHLGHLVPVTVTLPDAYLAATGIDPSLATFTLSLAPLVFAAFTGLFAARSGRRAAEAGAPFTGWISGSLVFAALASVVALTANAALVASEVWLAILLPSVLFAGPALLGAVVAAWRIGDDGLVDSLRAHLARLPRDWAAVPTLALRGVGITTLGLVAVGGVVVTAGLIARSAQIIALYQASNVDGIGATVIALGQLVYLPTLVLWAVSFAAGPGFALGTDTAITPAATQVGALPAIPVLGIVPDATSSWLLLLVLLPLAVGAVAGAILRSRMPRTTGPEPLAPRLSLAVAVAVLTGGVGALIAVVARGAIGPGRLVETGPEPGPLALALGLEVLVGLAILLLSPRIGPSRADDDVWAPRTETVAPRAAAILPDPYDRDADATGPAPRVSAPGMGIQADVHPEWDGVRPSAASADPAGSARPVDVGGAPAALAKDEPLSEDEVRARIRAAWSRADDTDGDRGA